MRTLPRAGRVTTALMIACLMLPQTLWAQSAANVAREGAVDEDPNGFAMLGDFLVARPIGLVLTAGGTALWLVSLPFTLLAGNANQAADTLILGPGEQTFMRCLGCRQSGYTYKDMEQADKSRMESAQVDQ
jgi:hypothetical protein